MFVALNTNQPLKCSICLEELAIVHNLNGRYEVSKQNSRFKAIEQPDVVLLRKCAHLFHERCIVRWERECIIKRKDEIREDKIASCPMCRKDIAFFDICYTLDFPARYCRYLNGEITQKDLYPTFADWRKTQKESQIKMEP